METNVDAASAGRGLFCKNLPADIIHDVIERMQQIPYCPEANYNYHGYKQ